MRKLLVVPAIVAIAALTACAGPYHRQYASDLEYDGYYDGHYGAYPGGYWGSDGYFYYSAGNGNYRRDDEHHFRHERFEDGSPFRSDRERHE